MKALLCVTKWNRSLKPLHLSLNEKCSASFLGTTNRCILQLQAPSCLHPEPAFVWRRCNSKVGTWDEFKWVKPEWNDADWLAVGSYCQGFCLVHFYISALGTSAQTLSCCLLHVNRLKYIFLLNLFLFCFFPPLPDTIFVLCGLALLPLTWDKQPLWWAAIIGPLGGCLWLRAISTQASAPAACLLDQVCWNQCFWGVSCSCVLQELPCQDVCTTFLLQSWQRVR